MGWHAQEKWTLTDHGRWFSESYEGFHEKKNHTDSETFTFKLENWSLKPVALGWFHFPTCNHYCDVRTLRTMSRVMVAEHPLRVILTELMKGRFRMEPRTGILLMKPTTTGKKPLDM